MRISYLLLILLVGFVRERGEGAGPVPCFPKCPLSEEGRRLCESLLAWKPCVDHKSKQGADGSLLCSCQWSAVLSHPSYSSIPDSSECFQYSLNTCETNTQHAKTKLWNALHDIIALVRKIDESNKGTSGISEVTTQPGDIDSSLNQDMVLTGGWKTLVVTTTQKTLLMTSKPTTKTDSLYVIRRNHIAIFAALFLLILVIIVLFMVAKVRKDRIEVNIDKVGDLDVDNKRSQRSSFSTLLEKLRIHYRKQAKENALRGQPSGSGRSHPKMAKPHLAVPTKSSLERRNSTTSLKSVAGKKTDSCTMISGLTHGNTSGSDVEIDKEFRMFRTDFKEEFKSLLNIDQDKQ